MIHQIEPQITKKDADAVHEYMLSGGWLTEHNKTEEFEEKIAEFLGVRGCIAVNNGTIALYVALLAAGVGPGDKVAVPNFTMIATINAVTWTGATPVLIDIDECFNMDPDILGNEGSHFLDKLKALIYVPINGRIGQALEIEGLCNDFGITLIEDACQAFGSRFTSTDGTVFAGTFGKIGVFSLSPHKVITTGQGGLLISNDQKLLDKMQKLKSFHRVENGRDVHDGIGYNFKFTDVQAVIGLSQLKTIQKRLGRKRKIYQAYQHYLRKLTAKKLVVFQKDFYNNEFVPWFVDPLFATKSLRNRVMDALLKNDIQSRVFYPAISSQEPYSDIELISRPNSKFSADMIADCGLWLPSSLSLTSKIIKRVCGIIKKVVL